MDTSAELAQLGPLEQLRTGRLARRLIQLTVGLSLYGVSMAMMIRGNLGLAPWDALHIGVTGHLPLSFGEVVIGLSFLVLLLWIPLREIPGIGTLANALIIGAVADLALQNLHTPEHFVERLALTAGGVLLCGLSSALYIGAQLGRGPRDGLMTGLHRVTGLSLRLVRTGLELAVLLVGLLLGGSAVFGIGTVLFALSIGPLTQALLSWLLVPAHPDAGS
ncbi:YczE/YyaS/YitT family protein [Castellaniella sp.]|uniref:membrane protein YczE n=1 Tax=Castellaniella sp. TaxID=1955812 RepID=UPI003C796970